MAPIHKTQLETLRATYPVFEYRNYTTTLTNEGLVIAFEFAFSPTHVFKPSLLISTVTQAHVTALGQSVIDWYAFHIGLVEMLSYWKLVCSPTIKIRAGSLSLTQTEWWHKLLMKGMGEFFFVNQIEFTEPDFVRIIAEKSTESDNLHQNIKQDINLLSNSNIMIAVGGGKDSAVSLGIVGSAGNDGLGTFHISPTLAAQDCADISGIQQRHTVKRLLDPLLLTLNRQGFLNGHTPFSALAAFISTLTAHLFGYRYVVISNERSSNEGNVMFHGHEINHQYSKTYEFERDFQAYLEDYLAPQTTHPHYFSLLRPLYELQIAQLFAEFTQYHGAFRSCNRGQKTNAWCGECPKCLFTYLILSPFIEPARLIELFGQNLLDKPELLQTALELVGYAQQKPLECVGTHEENLLAVYLTVEKHRQAGLPLPRLLQLLQDQVLAQETDLANRSAKILKSWNSEHSLPAEFETQLQAALTKRTQVTKVIDD